jgi:flagellar basal-body rod modification protein FlgD
MASISPVNGTMSYSTSSDTNSTASRVPQKALGQNDFLKLLAVQFQTQDPMKPMEDTAFIAQMAQFSSLEQSTALSRDMSAMRQDQQRAAANSYLGHRVTVDAGEGETATGDVTAIDASGDAPKLIVDGKSYSLSAVLRVEPGLTTALVTPQTTPSNGI